MIRTSEQSLELRASVLGRGLGFLSASVTIPALFLLVLHHLYEYLSRSSVLVLVLVLVLQTKQTKQTIKTKRPFWLAPIILAPLTAESGYG